MITLTEYLDRHDMTAYELAKLAGVHPSILSRFINGNTSRLSQENAVKISEATCWALPVTALLYPDRSTEVYSPHTIVLRKRQEVEL